MYMRALMNLGAIDRAPGAQSFPPSFMSARMYIIETWSVKV